MWRPFPVATVSIPVNTATHSSPTPTTRSNANQATFEANRLGCSDFIEQVGVVVQ
jgi:hypothetical protein